jgi:hypothetical protein
VAFTDSGGQRIVALHSPQRTAERIADLVHASSITALHTARILRTATDAQGKRLDLWPQPGSGARITSYTPTQMVNLLLALAAGEPIRGPEVVADFRSLPHGTASLTHTSRETRHPNALLQYPLSPYSLTTTIRSPSKEPLLSGPTLGDDLDAMVEALADADTPANAREFLRSTRIILTLKPRRSAAIFIPSGESTQEIAYGEEQPATPSTLHRLLAGSAGETMGAMEALSVIWRENQEALRPPTNETAAIHPCQGTNAAALSQPPAPAHERGRPTPPVLSERESALNGYAAGPPFIIKERPDARYRQFSADSAGG